MSDRSGLSYRVRLMPERHEIAVELTVDEPAGGELYLESPTWVPGDYSFVAFGRDVFEVTATCGVTGEQLPVHRKGWQGYLVSGVTRQVQVDYRACCSSWDFSEACGILGDRAGVLTGARYLFVPEIDGRVTVAYELPPGWLIHHPSGARKIDDTSWEYPSYEVLLDTPVCLGAFDLITREVNGTPFHHLFLDRCPGFEAHAERLVDEIDAVAAGYYKLFGAFPFEDYTFVCAFNPLAEWGLEHLTSTMVGLGPAVFSDTDQHKTAVRVCAHELFHAWNVRRLRPAPLDALDFRRGSFTEGLWVGEGFTRYYEFLSCTRTGVYSAQQFLSSVVNYYRHLAALPAYGRVSPIDSSLTTFLNHDDQFPGKVNNTIDYYDAGMVIAFCVDARLRSQTPDLSLDKAFAGFYERFAGKGAGYTMQDIREFFDGVHPGLGAQLLREAAKPGVLSLAEQLRLLGFQVSEESVPYLGLVLANDIGPAIYGVLDTAPAGRSGIASQDVLTTVEGYTFDLEALKSSIASAEAVTVGVTRGNQPLSYTIPVARRSQIGKLTWQGSPQQGAAIARWLGQTFDPVEGAEISLDFYENFHGVLTVI